LYRDIPEEGVWYKKIFLISQELEVEKEYSHV